MKLVMLIVMFGLAAGQVLPKVKVTSRISEFTGRVNYPREYDEKAFDQVHFNSIKTIQIEDIKNGVIAITSENEIKKPDGNYYSHNLICHPLQNSVNENNKECLLQYLTIDSFTLKLYEFKFITSTDTKNLQLKLDEGKTCTIRNLTTDYQLFSIPGAKGNNLDFNTRTKKFELNGGNIDREPTIEFKGDKVSLKIGKSKFSEFTKDNSCYLLLQKIHYLLNMPVEECQNTSFVYFNLFSYTISNLAEVPSDIPAVGFIEIDPLIGIKFKDRPDLKFDLWKTN
jgi:hypothetical protein